MVSGCGNTSAKGVTAKYFAAVKAGDFDKAIECFTPAVQSQMEASKALADGIFGVDSGAMLNGLMGMINPQEYANYQFTPVDEKKTDDSHAVVEVEVKTGGGSGSTVVHCVKIDGQWYIEY